MFLSYVPCGEGIVFAHGDDIPFAGTCLLKEAHEGPHELVFGGIDRPLHWTHLGDGRSWARTPMTQADIDA